MTNENRDTMVQSFFMSHNRCPVTYVLAVQHATVTTNTQYFCNKTIIESLAQFQKYNWPISFL